MELIFAGIMIIFGIYLYFKEREATKAIEQKWNDAADARRRFQIAEDKFNALLMRRDDAMHAWYENTPDGRQYRKLAHLLDDVKGPDEGGKYVMGRSSVLDGGHYEIMASEIELAEHRNRFSKLELLRKQEWQRVIEKLPIHNTPADPDGRHYLSIETYNAYIPSPK